MNSTRWPAAAVIAPAAFMLAACAVNPPMIFGDQVTFGLQAGTDMAAAGGAFTVGYKQRSVAVVPVSVLKADGQAAALRGSDGTDRDALSVFAVFEATAPSPNDRLRIGQIFATGSAAQEISAGYECHLRRQANCAAPAAAGAASAAAAPAAATSPVDTARPPAPGAQDRPYQRPLVYARTDVAGIELGGSSAEQGSQFTFGWSSRNLALIPVYAPSAGNQVTGLYGGLDDAARQKDAFSVLGQFSGETRIGTLGFGLKRFFATGIAAKNLASGLRIAIPAAQAASAQ